MQIKLFELKRAISTIVIVEGRVEDARNKFPDLSDEDFDYLVQNQPTGSNNKYLMWSCERVEEFFENDPDKQALNVVIQAVRLFDGTKQRLEKKDLYQYKTVGEIEDAVKKLGGESKNQISKIAKANSDLIYNDERFTVIRPHTTEASCKYGIGTRWCIAATASHNYFSSYSKSNNKFYFVIDKKAQQSDKSSKFAVVIIDPKTTGGEAIQVYNAADIQVGLQTVANHVGEVWPEIWKKIKEHVSANPITREVEEAQKAVEVHVKNLLAGKGVSKEGFEKIIHDAPLTTEVVKALIKVATEFKGDYESYDHPVKHMITRFAYRASDMSPDGAMYYLKAVPGFARNDSYYVSIFIRDARLTPEHLRELAKTADKTILASIVSNPNTPQDVIESLSDKIGEIQDRELKDSIYARLIKDGTITADQMREAMTKWNGRYTLFSTPGMTANLSQELLSLIDIRSAYELESFLAFPNAGPEIIASYFNRYWKLLPKRQLYSVLRKTNFHLSTIEKIWSENSDPEIRTSLLTNSAIGEDNIKKFATSKNHAYRFAIAHNPSTPADVLDDLSKDESASTRSAVAAHPNATSELLKKLASDEANIVRASAAGNHSTPLNMLTLLKKDSDPSIKKIAAQTIKALTRAESILRNTFSSLIIEELTDNDEMPDIMNPSWRELFPGNVKIPEFVAIYLLQNNGSATIEEIEEAYQALMGKAGKKALTTVDKIVRGTTAVGAGWYWAPAGIKAGSLFRLTPLGASAAMAALAKHRVPPGKRSSNYVSSATAIPGKTYYIAGDYNALDITGYETGEISIEQVLVNRDGEPQFIDGKIQKPKRRGDRSTKVFKCISPQGEVKYKKNFPKVTIRTNTPVTYVKPFIGYESKNEYDSDSNLALVKSPSEHYLLVAFPLWAMRDGKTPEQIEPNVAPPVKKTPMRQNLSTTSTSKEEPTQRTTTPREPRQGYKIYGRKGGRPAHTRLKGQAFGAPTDTRFSAGEQASIEKNDDGRLTVKKLGNDDHTQIWDPIDG